jgi:hypothetical protein
MKHTKEQIQTKIDALKFTIESISDRAIWLSQPCQMTERCKSAIQLVEELEREILE